MREGFMQLGEPYNEVSYFDPLSFPLEKFTPTMPTASFVLTTYDARRFDLFLIRIYEHSYYEFFILWYNNKSCAWDLKEGDIITLPHHTDIENFLSKVRVS